MIVNFWVTLGIKMVLVLGVMLGGALLTIYGELKIGAHMQSRIGPYFAGGRFGWAQPLADGLKFVQKEEIIPDTVDVRVFKLAPYIVLMGTMSLFVVIPFGPDLVAGNLDLGVFYLLAVSSVSTIGVLMAGWSSGNKYSLMGGIRAAAQLIAYELPLVLAVVGVVILAGSLSLNEIVVAQSQWQWFGVAPEWLNIIPPYLILQAVGFAIFLVASLAELSRTPFDMPIAESELVMGYLTEYSGLRFTMFFLGEYAGMVALAAIASTLFLGGYWFPFVSDDLLNFIGPVVLVGKVAAIVFVFIWVRWTFPRLREDQLQSMAWRILIPVALANIVVTAVLKVVF